MIAARRAVIAALLSLLVLPATAAANDDFTSARAIGRDVNEQLSNAGATPVGAAASSEPLTPGGAGRCDDGHYSDSAGVVMTQTIWWRVTGNGYPITVDTRGSAIDTLVAVYDGTPSAATLVTCHDDIRSTGANPNRDSEAVFNTIAGATYYVQVGCAFDCGANATGIIDFIAWSSPPGDFSDEAVALQTGEGASGEIRGATEQNSEILDCRGVPFSRTVWFRYRAPGPGVATFTAGGTFDSVLSVYRGAQFVDCDDDPSQVRTRVAAGDYLIQVGTVGIAPDAPYGSGTFRATVAFTPDPPPPPGDRDRDGVVDSADRCPDQNASARDANRDGCLDPHPDPDGDGVPVGTDKCPTQNAAGRDANRDGCLDPKPRKRLVADSNLQAKGTATGLRVSSLRVTAPKGSRVIVRCGRGCRVARKASVAGPPVAVAARTLRIKKLAGRSFRAGQKIRIYVTRKGRIGVYIEYRIKRGGLKPKIRRCLNPGSMKPRKRCT